MSHSFIKLAEKLVRSTYLLQEFASANQVCFSFMPKTVMKVKFAGFFKESIPILVKSTFEANCISNGMEGNSDQRKYNRSEGFIKMEVWLLLN